MVKEPESMEELVYFTKRKIDNGRVMAWVYRNECPKCNKALMSKPINEKTGKPMIRAKEYVCPECNNTVEKQEYEDTLTCEIKYTCPKCEHQGETEIPFIRKKVQTFNEAKQKKVTVDALVFHCENCQEKILITKKLK